MLVVLQQRREWTVAHLDVDDLLPWQSPNQVEVVGATLMVPDVDAHSSVVPVGGLDDPEGVGGGGDVGGRQELEADQQSVIGGPITQGSEHGRSVGDRSGVGSQDVEAPTTELVGDAEGGCFLLGRVGSVSEPERVDLGQAEVSLVEETGQTIGGVLGFESLEVA